MKSKHETSSAEILGKSLSAVTLAIAMTCSSSVFALGYGGSGLVSSPSHYKNCTGTPGPCNGATRASCQANYTQTGTAARGPHYQCKWLEHLKRCAPAKKACSQ